MLPNLATGRTRAAVKVISADELIENGGSFRLQGRVAYRVNNLTGQTNLPASHQAMAVYPITQADIDSGRFALVGGGPAVRVVDIDSEGISRVVMGGGAVPVYVVEGDALGISIPDAPANLVATLSGSTQIDLTWNAVDGADGYYIERSDGDNSSFVQIDSSASNAYSDTGLSPDIYYYRVRAFNVAGNSGYSNEDDAFLGFLDGYSNIQAVYSVRRLRSAYTGNALLLRRSSDNAELAFGFLANGDLDTGAITTWLGGGSGFVTTWYDQGGNARNIVQATADNQPLYVASGPNSKPTIRFDGANDRLRTTFANVPQPHHIFATTKLVSYTDGDYMFAGGATLEIAVIETGGTGRVLMITGGTGPNKLMGTTVYRVMGFYYTTVLGANYIRMDGNQSTGVGVTVGNANVTGVTLGARGDQANFGNVDISEWILFNAEKSNSPVEVNMGSYYGVTIP